MSQPSGPRLYGPKRIPQSRQVAIPKELMKEIGWTEGKELYFLAWKGRVLLVPDTELGQHIERLYRELALPD